MAETIRRTCGCCGTIFHVRLPERAAGQNGFFYDLDNRPPEPARSELYRQIFRCPECGFCMGPKDRKAERSFVESGEYKTCEGRLLPDGAGADFYRVAMSSERDGDIKTALAAVLRAAWFFDDAEDDANAVKCREKYIELSDKMRGSDSGALVVLADVYRRAGRYMEVAEQFGSRWFPDRITRQMIEFEQKLDREGDRSGHSMKEFFDWIDGDK